MNDPTDIRWRQRLNQYGKALALLGEAVAAYRQRPLTRLEKQGAIKAFEFTHELAWNVMKDFFAWQGDAAIMGSRDATREAFAIANRLDDLLLPYKIDLALYSQIDNPALREHVDRVGVVLYSSECANGDLEHGMELGI